MLCIRTHTEGPFTHDVVILNVLFFSHSERGGGRREDRGKERKGRKKGRIDNRNQLIRS